MQFARYYGDWGQGNMAKITYHSVQYSMIQHIESNIAQLTGVHWLYTGMPKPDIAALPFATVELMINAFERVSKDLTVESDMLFQVGVGFTDANEHHRIVQDMTDLLMFEPAILYDTSGLEPVAIGTFQFWVRNVTNFGTDEIDEISNYNRTYLDVTGTITLHKK